MRARLLWKQEGETAWQTTEMRPLGNDRWQGEFSVKQVGRYRYTLVGEVDHFGYVHNFGKARIERPDFRRQGNLQAGAFTRVVAVARRLWRAGSSGRVNGRSHFKILQP